LIHPESISSGHYCAQLKLGMENWYSFNDSIVEVISCPKTEKQYFSSSSGETPYILIHIRTDCIGKLFNKENYNSDF
jgi:ubiquitin C-terminal hydrolase